jgi:hypothetical protein
VSGFGRFSCKVVRPFRRALTIFVVIASAVAIPNAPASARVRAADDGSSPVAVLVDDLSTSNGTGSPSYEATVFSPSAASPAASAVIFRNAKTQDIQAMSSATGAVFGVAHSSGTNTAAPATAQQPRSFYAAFAKVGTRYGPAGPGGVLVRTANGDVDALAVVPNAHDGTTIPGHSSLGSLALDPQEQQLFVVNLHDRFVYQVDTWDSAAVPLALPALPALLTPETCNGHASDLQPAALHVSGTRLLLGTVCTGETSSLDQDVSAAVWAFDLVTNTWAVKPVFETTFGPPAGLFRIARHWVPNGPAALPAPRQLLLSHIDIAESGTLLLGFRNRGADTTTLPTAGDEGLVLRATPTGEGWADPFLDRGALDTSVVTRGLLGALAATPGSVWGLPGDELAATARSLDPNGANGLVWLDRANPQPAQTETLSATSANALPGALGDLTLLATWRSVAVTVFSDANADGVQQASEVALDGVRLSVSVAGDANITATVTSGVLDGKRGQVRLYLSPFERYQLAVDATTFTPGGIAPGGRRTTAAGELALGAKYDQVTAPSLGISALTGAPSTTIEPQVLAATAMPTTGSRPGGLLVAGIALVGFGVLFIGLTKIGHPARRREFRG